MSEIRKPVKSIELLQQLQDDPASSFPKQATFQQNFWKEVWTDKELLGQWLVHYVASY